MDGGNKWAAYTSKAMCKGGSCGTAHSPVLPSFPSAPSPAPPHRRAECPRCSSNCCRGPIMLRCPALAQPLPHPGLGRNRASACLWGRWEEQKACFRERKAVMQPSLRPAGPIVFPLGRSLDEAPPQPRVVRPPCLWWPGGSDQGPGGLKAPRREERGQEGKYHPRRSPECNRHGQLITICPCAQKAITP